MDEKSSQPCMTSLDECMQARKTRAHLFYLGIGNDKWCTCSSFLVEVLVWFVDFLKTFKELLIPLETLSASILKFSTLKRGTWGSLKIFIGGLTEKNWTKLKQEKSFSWPKNELWFMIYWGSSYSLVQN